MRGSEEGVKEVAARAHSVQSDASAKPSRTAVLTVPLQTEPIRNRFLIRNRRVKVARILWNVAKCLISAYVAVCTRCEWNIKTPVVIVDRGSSASAWFTYETVGNVKCHSSEISRQKAVADSYNIIKGKSVSCLEIPTHFLYNWTLCNCRQWRRICAMTLVYDDE